MSLICNGMKLDGNPCSRKTNDASEFCWQHSNQKPLTLDEARAIWLSGSRFPYHPVQENYKDILDGINNPNEPTNDDLAVLLIGSGFRGLNPMYAFPDIDNFFIIDYFDKTLAGFQAIMESNDTSVEVVKKALSTLAIDKNVIASTPAPNVEKYSFHSIYHPEIERNITIFRLDISDPKNIDFVRHWIYPLKLIAVVFGSAVPHEDAHSLKLLTKDLIKNNGIWIKENWQKNADAARIDINTYFNHFLNSVKSDIIAPKVANQLGSNSRSEFLPKSNSFTTSVSYFK